MFFIVIIIAIVAFLLTRRRERLNSIDEFANHSRLSERELISHKRNKEDEAVMKGKFGESLVAEVIRRTLPNAKVYNDIIIDTPTGSAQIDHVVVDKTGIFVIETKNYQGIIYGYEQAQMWTQYLGNTQNKFYNPIKQNDSHIRWLKQYLPKYCHNNIKSCVIFTFANISKVRSDTVNSIKELPIILQANKTAVHTESQLAQIETALQIAIEKCKSTLSEHIAYTKSVQSKTSEQMSNSVNNRRQIK